MSSLEFSVDGLDSVLSRIDSVAAAIPPAVTDAYRGFAADLMDESQRRVPFRFGDLHDSAFVDPPESDGSTLSLTLGYRGYEYAIYVHEALEGARPPSPNWSWTKKAARGEPIEWTTQGTGPKYLEGPANEMESQLPGRVCDAVSSALG